MGRTKFGQLAVAILMITGMQVAQADGRFHPPFEVTGSVIKNHDGDIAMRQVMAPTKLPLFLLMHATKR